MLKYIVEFNWNWNIINLLMKKADNSHTMINNKYKYLS